jgi:DNA repair protein RadC
MNIDKVKKKYEIKEIRMRLSEDPERIDVETPEEFAKLAREVFENFSDEKEHLFAFFMNAACRVEHINHVSTGGLTSSEVHPREVFKPALHAGAASIILVHNHPSGDPEPSDNDLAVTERLEEVGEMVGIPIIDHVILGNEDRYYSFTENQAHTMDDLLDKLLG